MIRHSLPYLLAFASGGILSLMVLLNGQWVVHGTPLFASWMAHGTGIGAAVLLLILLRRPAPGRVLPKIRAPFWAYLGGVSGAVTVMLSSFTVNTPLALSGTLALGLVGQAGFSLLSDNFGWFGLPQRRIAPLDLAVLALILGGSLLIIFAGGL